MSKKAKSPVHPSDDLAAIDEELNAAMELVDVTNVKVNEILGATEGSVDAPAAAETATKEAGKATPAEASATAHEDDSEKEDSGDS